MVLKDTLCQVFSASVKKKKSGRWVVVLVLFGVSEESFENDLL